MRCFPSTRRLKLPFTDDTVTLRSVRGGADADVVSPNRIWFGDDLRLTSVLTELHANSVANCLFLPIRFFPLTTDSTLESDDGALMTLYCAENLRHAAALSPAPLHHG